MNDERLRAIYLTRLQQRMPEDRGECPSPDAIANLAEQQGAEAERIATLNHVMSCEACRKDFEIVRAVASAERRDRSLRRWRPWLALAASLALVASVGVLWSLADGGPFGRDAFRGAGDTMVVLTSPRGSVAGTDARRLVWRAVPNAVRYEVELLTGSGSELLVTETTDSMLTLPAAVALEPGAEYQWWVTAQLSDGTERRAVPVRFTVR